MTYYYVWCTMPYVLTERPKGATPMLTALLIAAAEATIAIACLVVAGWLWTCLTAVDDES